MDAHRTEVEKWAKDNGIDPQYVMFGPGGGHGGHFGIDNTKGVNLTEQ